MPMILSHLLFPLSFHPLSSASSHYPVRRARKIPNAFNQSVLHKISMHVIKEQVGVRHLDPGGLHVGWGHGGSNTVPFSKVSTALATTPPSLSFTKGSIKRVPYFRLSCVCVRVYMCARVCVCVGFSRSGLLQPGVRLGEGSGHVRGHQHRGPTGPPGPPPAPQVYHHAVCLR